MTKFVDDANVAVKWVLPEIYAEAASRLLNSDYTLLVKWHKGEVLWSAALKKLLRNQK